MELNTLLSALWINNRYSVYDSCKCIYVYVKIYSLYVHVKSSHWFDKITGIQDTILLLKSRKKNIINKYIVHHMYIYTWIEFNASHKICIQFIIKFVEHRQIFFFITIIDFLDTVILRGFFLHFFFFKYEFHLTINTTNGNKSETILWKFLWQ